MNIFKVNNLIIASLFIVFLLNGCAKPEPKKMIINDSSRLADLPETAEILFLSNKDAVNKERPYRKEIYSMDRNGKNITRITFTEDNHAVMALDKSKRFLLTSRAHEDTDKPKGIGDEDRKNIWILDLETKEEKRLVDPENLAEGDSFSPDGEWIVFFMMKKGEKQADIYKIKLDGTELTNLTNTPKESEADPVWSNKGDRIAYVSYSAKAPRFIMKIMNADGSEAKTIYDSEDERAKGNKIFPPGVYDPSWSPNDEWIVFESFMEHNNENGQAGIANIFKIRPDGTGLVDLSTIGKHTGRAEYLPHFSPDGESIVFTARYGPVDPAQVKIDIFTMDKNGGLLKKLTDDSGFQELATWIK